jgi:Acetyltransferase (GNAT) domain
LLAFLQSHNCDYIYLIATALGEPVYAKVGFVTESRYNYFKNVNLKDFEISENIIPFKPEFKQAIFDLDKPISGEDRSQHLEPFFKDSYVYFENNEVLGAYFPTFGDGLIIAKTDETGTELMKKRFQTFEMVSIPEANIAANAFLQSHGYKPNTSHARMYFGKQMPWRPEGLYNRVGGKIG